MTDHLNDDLLNEYLDGGLGPAAHALAAAHLEACPDCARRLRVWQAVFTQLDTLPDEPLARDLSADVVAGIMSPAPFRPRPLLRLAFAAQAVLAVGLLIVAAPFLSASLSGLDPAVWSQPVQFFAADTLNTLAAEWAAVQTAVDRLWADSAAFASQFTNPITNTTALMWGALLTTALVLWVIGNGVLLRSTLSARRPS